MKKIGLVTCHICHKRIAVKNSALIGYHYVCSKHPGVSREVECENAKKAKDTKVPVGRKQHGEGH